MDTITLADGRVFPQYEGESLSWSIGSYQTLNEERQGFPRMRAVIRAMMAHRPAQLETERREYLRASFGSMFGHNALQALRVIDEEMARNNYTPSF